nr:uncharacterized protein LOC100201985 [Hydra vulgaris]
MSDEDDIPEEENNLGHYEGERNEAEQRHGMGKAFFPNGDTYEGMYALGKRNGKGVYHFATGAVFDGEYKLNKKEGSGIMTYPDGSKYEGDWLDDVRHGKGIYWYPNGDKYDGDWLRNFRNGSGVYLDAQSGSKTLGTWYKGKLHGPVQIILASHIFEGTYQENYINGAGKFIFPSYGVELRGRYNLIEKNGGEEQELADEENAEKQKESVWKTYSMNPLEEKKEEEIKKEDVKVTEVKKETLADKSSKSKDVNKDDSRKEEEIKIEEESSGYRTGGPTFKAGSGHILCKCPIVKCDDFICTDDCDKEVHCKCKCIKEYKIPSIDVKFIYFQRIKTGTVSKFQIGLPDNMGYLYVLQLQEKVISDLNKDFDKIAKSGEVKCIFFDGRIDQTKQMIELDDSNAKFPVTVKEEHYSVCMEPGRKYLFHFTPEKATNSVKHAEIIANKIVEWLTERGIDESLLAVCGDSTNVNTG